LELDNINYLNDSGILTCWYLYLYSARKYFETPEDKFVGIFRYVCAHIIKGVKEEIDNSNYK